MVESLDISAEIGAYAMVTVNFKSKKGETTSNSVTYTTEKYLLAKH